MKKKRYRPAELREAIERYFLTISRIVKVTEKRPTGEYDEMGHMIFEDVTCINRLGEACEKIEFLLPPSCGGLCAALGISRNTWAKYEKDESLKDICENAKDVIRLWNEEQLLERSGRDVKGIIFNLQNNFGYCEKMQLQSEQGKRLTMEQKRQILQKLKERELKRESRK